MATQDNLPGQLAAVGLVILLLLAALYFLKRKGGWRPRVFFRGAESKSILRVVGREALTGQHAIFAVEIEGVRFLVATHPSGVQLSRLSPSFPMDFEKSLQGTSGGHDA